MLPISYWWRFRYQAFWPAIVFFYGNEGILSIRPESLDIALHNSSITHNVKPLKREVWGIKDEMHSETSEEEIQMQMKVQSANINPSRLNNLCHDHQIFCDFTYTFFLICLRVHITYSTWRGIKYKFLY